MSQVCSIFSQLLKLFPRAEFEQAVRQHRGERHARGFTCWGQFVAMLFCQLGRAQSLREICGGLAASQGKLRHLGLSAAPPRSTLAYANRQRPWQIYETVFQQLLAKCRGAAPGHKFRFKNKLLSLDASVIDLCASLFDWAQFRRRAGDRHRRDAGGTCPGVALHPPGDGCLRPDDRHCRLGQGEQKLYAAGVDAVMGSAAQLHGLPLRWWRGEPGLNVRHDADHGAE